MFTTEGMFSIKDRPIIITGGTGGMGSVYGRIMAELGAKIALLDVNQEKLDAVVADIKEKVPGAEVIGMKVDITNEESVDSVFGQIYEKYGSIWGLLNCAGITHVEFLRTLDIANWQKVMDVNCKGTLIVDKYACKYMSMKKEGRIINISSPASRTGKPGYTPYTASKAAVDGITRTLAIEWGRRNITVNAIWPSFMVSVMTAQQWGDKLDDFVNGMKAGSVQGRLCTPELVIGLIVFLFSDCSSYINGQIISADGGSNAGFFNPSFPQDVYENEE